MNVFKSKHKIATRVVAMVLACLLVTNTVVISLASSENVVIGVEDNTLSRWLLCQALMDEGIEDPWEIVLEAVMGLKHICKGICKESETMVANSYLREAAGKMNGKERIEFVGDVERKDKVTKAKFKVLKKRGKIFEISESDENMQIVRVSPYVYAKLKDLVCMDNTLPSFQKLKKLESFLHQMHPGELPSIWEYVLRAVKKSLKAPESGRILDSLIDVLAQQLARVDGMKLDTSNISAYVPKFTGEQEHASLEKVEYNSTATTTIPAEEDKTIELPSLKDLISLSGTIEKRIPLKETTERTKPEVSNNAKFEIMEVPTKEGTIFATRTKSDPKFDFDQMSDSVKHQLIGRATINKNYGIKWDIIKTARDVSVQNYADGHCGTLDGVNYVVTRKESGEYILRIEGYGEYDMTKALTLGASGKRTESGEIVEGTQGKHGEGLKVAALLLLRDFGASRVIYSSRNWQVNYFIRSGEETLHPEINQVSDRGGNYTEIITSDPELIYNLLTAINLVYHSCNPDFQTPTLDNTVGGFKYLGSNHTSELNKGNLYLQGLRFQTSYARSVPAWENGVPGISFWTYRKSFAPHMLNRERPPVCLDRDQDSFKIAVKSVLEASSMEELLGVLRELEPVWSNFLLFEQNWKDSSYTGIYFLIEQLTTILATRLNKEGKQLDFGEKKFIAVDEHYNSPSPLGIMAYGREKLEELSSSEYQVCFPSVSKLKIATVTETLVTFKKLKKTDHGRPVNEFELRKLAIIKEAIDLLQEELGSEDDYESKLAKRLSKFCFLDSAQFFDSLSKNNVHGEAFRQARNDWKSTFYINREMLDGSPHNTLRKILSSENGLDDESALYPSEQMLWKVITRSWDCSPGCRRDFEDLVLLWEKVSEEQRKTYHIGGVPSQTLEGTKTQEMLISDEQDIDTRSEAYKSMFDDINQLMLKTYDIDPYEWLDIEESLMELINSGVVIKNFRDALIEVLTASQDRKALQEALAATDVTFYEESESDDYTHVYESLNSSKSIPKQKILELPSLKNVTELNSPFCLEIPVDIDNPKPQPVSIKDAKSVTFKKMLGRGFIWATRTTINPEFNFKQKTEDIDNLLGRGQIHRDYGIEWDLNKTLRDLHQGNFDGHSGTLEGTGYTVMKNPQNNEYTLGITGWGEYDLTKAMTVGDSGKQTETGDSTGSVGKHGEGLSIVALSLLRDYGASRVTYASANWRVDYSLPKGAETLEPAISEISPREGNYTEIITKDANLVYQILQGVNLMYHPHNPDFVGDIVNVPEVGGFKYLGFDPETQTMKRGNVYVGGQRFAVLDKEGNVNWDKSIQGMSFWIRELTYRDDFDRERSPINTSFRDELGLEVGILGEGIVSDKERIRILQITEDIWSDHNIFSKKPFKRSELSFLLHNFFQNIKIKFPDNYLSTTDWLDDVEGLTQQGYKICMPEMASIGMTTIEEHMQKKSEILTASPQEIQKLQILLYATSLLRIHGVYSEFNVYPFKLVDEWEGRSGGGPFTEVPKSVFDMDFNDALYSFIYDYANTSITIRKNTYHLGRVINGKTMSVQLQESLQQLRLLWHDEKLVDTLSIQLDASEKELISPMLTSQEKMRLFRENKDEEFVITRAKKQLNKYSINLHIDLDAIPYRMLSEDQQKEQLDKNVETLACKIAWYVSHGLKIRYVLENDNDKSEALFLLRNKLEELSERFNVSKEKLLATVGAPFTGDNVIKVILKTDENIGKMNKEINDWEFVVSLTDDPEKTGIPIPNYSAAAAIGIAQAILRAVAEETQEKDKFKKFDAIKNSTKETFLNRIKRIYQRYGVIGKDKDFGIDVLKFMVMGCSRNKIIWAKEYALRPIVKDLVNKINRFHTTMQKMLQAA
ncbi:MAG: hypothetical protein ISS33_01985 [Candidatus Omnitrophica bacterium]|nr:hypothetical protein [Candidatus Omnitrophota bacterium]